MFVFDKTSKFSISVIVLVSEVVVWLLVTELLLLLTLLLRAPTMLTSVVDVQLLHVIELVPA